MGQTNHHLRVVQLFTISRRHHNAAASDTAHRTSSTGSGGIMSTSIILYWHHPPLEKPSNMTSCRVPLDNDAHSAALTMG